MRIEFFADRMKATPIDASADAACRYPLEVSRQERLQKAGVLPGNFRLTS